MRRLRRAVSLSYFVCIFSWRFPEGAMALLCCCGYPLWSTVSFFRRNLPDCPLLDFPSHVYRFHNMFASHDHARTHHGAVSVAFVAPTAVDFTFADSFAAVDAAAAAAAASGAACIGGDAWAPGTATAVEVVPARIHSRYFADPSSMATDITSGVSYG